MQKILILFTTESSKSSAVRIAKKLIKEKLAACVSTKEISSFYIWEGELVNSNEYEITIKSNPEKLFDLIDTLKQESSYSIPQLIYKIYEAEGTYNNWVNNSVN
tara:strand:- start:254 stop:565 length:312 start_codon:yes stop_codon:yes gene_type:complete